jgi:hypothetical protein
VHPVVAVAVLLAAALIFFLRRRYVIIPFLSAGLLLPMDQLVVLGPFHFQMLRVLILCGWIRVLIERLTSKRPLLSTRLNTLDKLVILFALVDALDYVLLWQGSAEAFVNRCGVLYTVLGIYFLFRILIRNEEDVVSAIKVLAYVSAVIAVVMLIEQVTGRNPYAFLGGSRAWTREALMARSEKFRATAAFSHPILAGTFGGVSMPLFVGLWARRQREHVCAAVGGVSATLIVFASASSTPIMAYAAGIVGVGLWRLRKDMRVIRWGVMVGLVALHLVMKAPVWSLIQRVDLVGGSSSYHRYYLLDQFLRRFSDWWFLGMKSTEVWGADMWDHANQYVALGTTSGIVPLLLFLLTIVYGFRYLGTARRCSESDKKKCFFVWTLGAALFANVVGFFGISYFDQTVLVWWCLLAMITIAPSMAEKRGPVVRNGTSTLSNLNQPQYQN